LLPFLCSSLRPHFRGTWQRRPSCSGRGVAGHCVLSEQASGAVLASCSHF